MADKELFPGPDESAGSRFELFHPNRDLQSNWEVDLAAKLEEYLLKICSGEISSDQAHELHSVNFAEAALLLQGSVQVYSRKVEYLHSLVVRVLEFLSQNRQNLAEKASNQPDGSESAAVFEEDEFFIELDDVQVDPKNCLDDEFEKEDSPKHFARPPATLLVLEGDCLDSSGDGSELESYLLATCGLYGDFLLLDPSDAKAVYDYSRKNNSDKNDCSTHKGNTVRSKTCCSLLKSPTRSGGTVHKSNPGKNQGTDLNGISENNGDIGINNETQFSGSHVGHDYSDHETSHLDNPTGFFHPKDQSDDDNDNPWKLLNPHEPGNLKIKPFKRVKEFGRRVYHHSRQSTETSQFPIAKLDGIISPEYAKLFEEQSLQEKLQESHSLPLYEKLRSTLTFGEQEYYVPDDNNENGIGDDPSDLDEADLPDTMNATDAEVPLYSAKQGDAAFASDGFEAFEHENVDSHASLEDLCRFHLDSLLANIAETHKQTEIAARVSTWKQRVEGTLEEQEMRPPFDIHMYGERILDKLQLDADSEGCTSFSNIVRGQPKHEVARTFSALLQLVNNRDVDLQKPPANRELICHTATNPFYVRLCGNRSRSAKVVIRSARKRLKSPAAKGYQKNSSTPEATSPLKSPAQNGSSAVKLGLGSVTRFTPDGKRRRRSARLVEPLDLQSAGS